MKNWLRRKLHDQTGASLMVALLFFIVAAVVGSSILAAASSSMGRMDQIYVTSQNRNLLNSTAQVLAEKLGGEDTLSGFANSDNIKVVDSGLQVQFTETSDHQSFSTSATKEELSVNDTGTSLQNLRTQWIKTLIENHWDELLEKAKREEIPADQTLNYVQENDAFTSGLKRVELTMDVLTDTESTSKGTVYGDLYMDEEMNIEIHLYEKDSSDNTTFESASNRCLIQLYAKPGMVTFTQTAYPNRTTRTMRISNLGWGKAKLYYGASVDTQRKVSKDGTYAG